MMMETYAQSLDLSFYLREPAIRAAIQSLKLTPGSHGLDIGCGIGNITSLLAESVVPAGHVTGLDISTKMVAHARESAKKSALSEILSFREGDMNELPFANNCFDWAWSVDCVGYAPVEPRPLIQEMIRVVKPGGIIAILAWSSQQLLPGYPLLEARLNATAAGIAPFTSGKRPEKHFLHTLRRFRKLDLLNPTARTFVGDLHAPLNDKVRAALLSLIRMRWPGVQSELDSRDWAEYQRLCQPESLDYILDHPDYYAFFTYSMFSGEVPLYP